MTPLTEIISKEKYKLDQIVETFLELHELNPENNHWLMWAENIKDFSDSKGQELKETIKLEHNSKKEAKKRWKIAETFKKGVEHCKGVMK